MNHQFHVQGMTCSHCEATVKKALLKFDPQAQVHVDHTHDRVEVISDKPREQLIQVIYLEGYTVQSD